MPNPKIDMDLNTFTKAVGILRTALNVNRKPPQSPLSTQDVIELLKSPFSIFYLNVLGVIAAQISLQSQQTYLLQLIATLRKEEAVASQAADKRERSHGAPPPSDENNTGDQPKHKESSLLDAINEMQARDRAMEKESTLLNDRYANLVALLENIKENKTLKAEQEKQLETVVKNEILDKLDPKLYPKFHDDMKDFHKTLHNDIWSNAVNQANPSPQVAAAQETKTSTPTPTPTNVDHIVQRNVKVIEDAYNDNKVPENMRRRRNSIEGFIRPQIDAMTNAVVRLQREIRELQELSSQFLSDANAAYSRRGQIIAQMKKDLFDKIQQLPSEAKSAVMSFAKGAPIMNPPDSLLDLTKIANMAESLQTETQGRRPSSPRSR